MTGAWATAWPTGAMEWRGTTADLPTGTGLLAPRAGWTSASPLELSTWDTEAWVAPKALAWTRLLCSPWAVETDWWEVCPAPTATTGAWWDTRTGPAGRAAAAAMTERQMKAFMLLGLVC